MRDAERDMLDYAQVMLMIVFADTTMWSHEYYRFSTIDPEQFNKLINEQNREFVTEDAIDLLDKLLEENQFERLSASQALKHRYFGMLFC